MGLNRLDIAIEELYNEGSDLPFEARFFNLGKALMWSAYKKLEKIHKQGKKFDPNGEDEFKQIECMKQYRDMEKIYMSIKRMGKVSGKTEEQMDSIWKEEILKMKSSIGTIVRDLNSQPSKIATDAV